jgi:curved DNA-binding protein CbpA
LSDVHRDPYRVLGVSPGASSEELHDAYRRLVKLHHPDRNGGSEESARRFAEIQAAYEEVRARPRPARPHRAAEATEPARVSTDDSFGKILGDIREELADRISEGRRHPAVQRVGELIDDVVSRLDRR